MSRKLLTKLKKKPAAEKRSYNWRALALFPAWVLASFYGAQLLIGVIIWVMQSSGFDFAAFGSPAVIQTAMSATVYVLAFAIAFGVPYIMGRKVTLETLGLKRLMTWADIGLAPLGYIVYIVSLLTVLTVITEFIPGFQADQAQDIGFESLTNQLGYTLAFVTLVVLAPIAEEVLFRGYLYGKLRRHIPIWLAIIATSFLFGLVHWQWNVAVDTFMLGVVLCGLRELTGNIWAGILVHMIKNSIAYYLLFLSPLISPGM